MPTVTFAPHEADDYSLAKKGFLKKYYESNLRPTEKGFYVEWDRVTITFIDEETQIHFMCDDSRRLALQIDDLGGFEHAELSCEVGDDGSCFLDSEFNGDPCHWLFWNTRTGKNGPMTFEEI